MYQFFVENDQVSAGFIRIGGADYNHIANVLRMRAGEKVRVSDGNGVSYLCELCSFDSGYVTAKILERDELGTEFAHRIYLFQGLPKGDKMETVIQKAVELGVYAVVPVSMKHCVMKLDEKKVDNKLRRWNSISESAAKQSKRTAVPEVCPPMTFREAIGFSKELDVVLVPYENERGLAHTREVFRSIPEAASIGVFIGPEGGFAEDEINLLEEGMHRISLGRRILRTETAGMACLSMLVYELDI